MYTHIHTKHTLFLKKVYFYYSLDLKCPLIHAKLICYDPGWYYQWWKNFKREGLCRSLRVSPWRRYWDPSPFSSFLRSSNEATKLLFTVPFCFDVLLPHKPKNNAAKWLWAETLINCDSTQIVLQNAKTKHYTFNVNSNFNGRPIYLETWISQRQLKLIQCPGLSIKKFLYYKLLGGAVSVIVPMSSGL